MKKLFLIPARGGSKGIPKKNIKKLNGKALIEYSLDIAKSLSNNDEICVTTDSTEIKETVENYGFKVPFLRPDNLSNDFAGMYEVIMHALDFYKTKGIEFDILVLLQPTSPLRTNDDVKEAIEMYNKNLDMVVSVRESDANPYYNIFEENGNGYLQLSKPSPDIVRRQDAPKVYLYNGAIYVLNVQSLYSKNINQFEKIRKYVMSPEKSVDLDTLSDWNYCEYLMTLSKK